MPNEKFDEMIKKYEEDTLFYKTKISELFIDINVTSLFICREMEGTCDECPFGVWNDKKQGYDCGFEKFVLMIKKYEEEYNTKST